MEAKAIVMLGYLNEGDIPQIQQFITGDESTSIELKEVINKKVGSYTKVEPSHAGRPELLEINKEYMNVLDSYAIKIKESNFLGSSNWSFKNVEINRLISNALFLDKKRIESFSNIFSSEDYSEILRVCLDKMPLKIPCMLSTNVAFYQSDNNDILNISFTFNNNVLQMNTKFNISPVKVLRVLNKYHLIDGHHRAYALKKCGFDYIPSIVLNDNPGIRYSGIYHFSNHTLLREDPPIMKYFLDEDCSEELPLRKKSVMLHKIQIDSTAITV
mgnify:CR=1 FL=1